MKPYQPTWLFGVLQSHKEAKINLAHRNGVSMTSQSPSKGAVGWGPWYSTKVDNLSRAHIRKRRKTETLTPFHSPKLCPDLVLSHHHDNQNEFRLALIWRCLCSAPPAFSLRAPGVLCGSPIRPGTWRLRAEHQEDRKHSNYILSKERLFWDLANRLSW